MALKNFMSTTKKYFETILIGPTGFLGLSFLEQNPEILAVGRKKPPQNIFNEFLKIKDIDEFTNLDAVDFDYAIFLIGSSEHKILNTHPTLAIEKNLIPLMTFLDYCSNRKRLPKMIVAFTTMLQYNSNTLKNPCKESSEIDPIINNYVLSKYFAELATKMYRKKLSIIDIRLSNVYGPTPLKRPDIVPSLVWSLLTDNETFVWNKNPVRDFVYIDNVVYAVMKLLHSSFSGPINVGSGIGRSVKDLCSILEGLSNKPIIDKGLKVSGHMHYVHDIQLLKSIIPNYEPIDLEEGLKFTYSKMKKYYES